MNNQANKFNLQLLNVSDEFKSTDLKIVKKNVWQSKFVGLSDVDGKLAANYEITTSVFIDASDVRNKVSVTSDKYDVDSSDLSFEPADGTSSTLTDEDEVLAQAEGWGLFQEKGEFQVQAITEIGTFSQDADVHEFIKAGAESGSLLHNKVKEILFFHNQAEYQAIFW
jgi:hypothetical protein